MILRIALLPFLIFLQLFVVLSFHLFGRCSSLSVENRGKVLTSKSENSSSGFVRFIETEIIKEQ